MPDLGNAYINIVPRAPGIKSNVDKLLNNAAGKSSSGIGKEIGTTIVKGIGATFVAAGTATFAAAGKVLSDAFAAGADLQQSFGGLDTLYGDAAAGAKEYALAAAQAGINANTYAEQAVSMGAALKSAFKGDTTAAMEAANTAILDMADNSAKLGSPIESIQAAYQGFAKGQYQLLDNLKLGYSGTKDEMKRLLADAKKVTGVKYDIDNLGDVYEAIHVIQGELGLTGVAADEAKTTFSGSLNALKASWTNVMAALTTGEGLETSLQNLSESAKNFASNILQMLGQVGPQVPSFIKGIADTIIAHAPSLLESGVEIVLQLMVGFVNTIPEVVAQIPMLFDKISTAFSTVDWKSLGIAIVEGIIKGIVATASSLYETLKRLAKQAFGSAKDELEVNSPSKKFIPLGRAMPEGMAVGAEDGASLLNSKLRSVAALSVSTMKQATSTASAGKFSAGVQSGHAAAAQPVNVNVVLQGDAKQMFKVVKTYNDKRTRATNYNSLARGMA